MRQEIFGKGLKIDKVIDGKGIVASDKKYYSIIGIDPEDYEEAGIRIGARIKGTIVSTEKDDSTFYHIESWKISGEAAVEEPEEVKEVIRKKSSK